MSTVKRVLPFSIFKKQIKNVLEDLESSDSTLVVTIRGRGEFVVQTLEKYSEFEQLARHGHEQLAIDDALRSQD